MYVSRSTPPDRARTLCELTGRPLDLLVIGGGIVGAGIARDAALRGLRVGLVEQHDFAFGTSSRSSRLLHGGLRYLAQGRIGLVREASVEKRIIHRIAPHISAPLAFVFPTYRCRPWSAWALWKLRIGVKVYDLLCRGAGGNLGRSSGMNAAALAGYIPGLCTEGLTGGVRYYDGLTNDARLVIDSLRSAANAGAWVVNYVRFEGADPIANLWHCRLHDRLSSTPHTLAVRTIINATGPWAQAIEHSAVKLRLTKGVHLVIDRHRLPLPDAVVMTEGDRILFAIPWGERVILGTTDTDYHGRIEDVHTEPADVRYILGVVNACFPRAQLAPDDVIADWAGLRPLVANSSGGPSDISRAHEIRSPRPGWWDVTGGKLTTYRLMAEQTVDLIEDYLGRQPTPCRTATTPILDPAETAGLSGLIPPEVTRGAVEHYCRREWAVTLDDVMIRRTGWQYYARDAATVARQVAGWMGEFHGWDDATTQVQLHHLTATAEAQDSELVSSPAS